MPKRAHTLPPATPLSQQVGGHAGVHVTEDESLLLKPALPREIAFYQFVRDVDDPSTGLYALRSWMPNFLGLLNLEGKLADVPDPDTEASPAIVPISPSDTSMSESGFDSLGHSGESAFASPPPQTLVLENLLHGYRKPCVLDVKLGTVLYDEDATEEKKARMIKKAAETTSLETGIRLTGFQVYSNHSPEPMVYGREYGYSLKQEQLHEGINHFFPCSASAHQVETGLKHSNMGLPADTLLTLLTLLCGSLTDLRKSLAGAHVRMIGGSVLIIYEGDWERATAASGRGGGPNEVIVEGQDDNESESDQIEVDENGEIIMEGTPELETLSSPSSESSCTNSQPCLYTVSLIDFAHTRIVPGEGPDRGVLKGMDTLIRLIDARQKEVALSINGGKEH